MKLRIFLAVLLATSLCAQAQTRTTTRRARTAAARATPVAGADDGRSTTAATTISRARTLPIRRVTLYSNGVAYIERRGMVTGHAEIDLSFKQSQVDDVLKSMVVLDLGQGRIGAVSYNSSAPPAARMADIPFSVAAQTENDDDTGGLSGVLAQLQGARVVVTTASRTVTGSILTVEKRKAQLDANKPPVITHALVISTEGGELASFDLADVRAVKLIDEGARRDLSEFASATASARRRDAKTIVVTSDGAGAREMLVSYTVAAPIWKTTYRVVLDAAGKPFFQGWAIVDNVSDEDWEDVQLSLISGTPISFIQPIQKPFYRYRPVVPMPDDLKLTPQVYEPNEDSEGGSIAGTITDANGAVVPGAAVTIRNKTTGQEYKLTTSDAGIFKAPSLASGDYTVTINAPGFQKIIAENVRVSSAASADLSLTLNVGSVEEAVTVSGTSVSGSRFRQKQILDLPTNGRNNVNNLQLSAFIAADAPAPQPTLGEAITNEASGVTTAAEGSEVGDLFEYRIAQPVTVRRDRSALIPILQTRMDGERVSIYNEAARRDRPLSGMLLKNTSTLTLEDGSLTVIDGNSYAGEALLERLKPSEQRLVSFALDLGTLVNARVKSDRAPAFLVRIINGVFQAHYHQEDKKVYTLVNQTERARVVFVEHPVRQGWELSKDTPTPDGKSARYYRFRVALEPHQKFELNVTERRVLVDTYALSNFNPDLLALFITRRYVDEPTRAALQNLIDLKGRLAAVAAREQAVDAEIEAIGADQKRLRENIEALTKTAEAKQLIARYVAKADQQETRIEELTKEKQTLAIERARLQTQLDAAIRNLNVDRNLTE